MIVAVIGAGLAGSLLALELAELGVAVRLFDPDPAGASATALSYGAVAGWAAPPTRLGRLMRQAPGHWRKLQRRYGDLGWRQRWLRSPAMPLPLPCGQVEVHRFLEVLPALLQRQGVAVIRQPLQRLERQGESWCFQLANGDHQRAEAVVLAAGAACGDLWPGLSKRLWVSWAGVLELEDGPEVGRVLRLPARFERLELERRAADLDREAWVVDGGLVPWADRVLAGQISLIRPTPRAANPPDPDLMEQRLRRGLQHLDPALPTAAGRYRQAPVAFCHQGPPLAGPVPGAPPGLWQFTGFSAGFSQAPLLAPLLAQALTAKGDLAAAAEDGLRRLGVGCRDAAEAGAG